jgi:hypothetical protein
LLEFMSASFPTDGTPTPGDYDFSTYLDATQQSSRSLRSLAEQLTQLDLRDFRSRDPEYQERLGEAAKPLSGREQLQRLALSEAIVQHARRFRGANIHGAVCSGARWPDIAAAVGLPVRDAQSAYRQWANDQHDLHRSMAGSEHRFGLDAHEVEQALASLDSSEAER